VSLPRRRVLSIGLQVGRMTADFPSFRYSKHGSLLVWRGNLQPMDSAPNYQVRIEYEVNGTKSRHPRIFIEDPPLRPDAPHTYSPGNICLYYPPDGTWTPNHFVSRTIVPLIAEWLAFYEIWKETGIWYGPEKQHGANKSEE
jgi:hypothetical protein